MMSIVTETEHEATMRPSFHSAALPRLSLRHANSSDWQAGGYNTFADLHTGVQGAMTVATSQPAPGEASKVSANQRPDSASMIVRIGIVTVHIHRRWLHYLAAGHHIHRRAANGTPPLRLVGRAGRPVAWLGVRQVRCATR